MYTIPSQGTLHAIFELTVDSKLYWKVGPRAGREAAKDSTAVYVWTRRVHKPRIAWQMRNSVALGATDIVIARDGDRKNLAEENLVAISAAEGRHFLMARNGIKFKLADGGYTVQVNRRYVGKYGTLEEARGGWRKASMREFPRLYTLGLLL